MPLAEWAALQDKFGDFQLLMRGHPDLAMFVDSAPGEEAADVYLVGPKIELVEAMSPGNWEDSGKPHGEHVSLLVGTADSWERHGIAPPSTIR